MEHYRDDWNDPLIPEKKLRIVVVGAGIAGLVTGIALKRSGHEVIILEQVREMVEVGAGIQMAPNNLRILGRLGVLPEVLKSANLLTEISLRRWKDDEELGTAPLMPHVAEQYGAPIGVIHRGDLQRILLEAARREGCEIRTDHRVIKADDHFAPRVQLQGGDWIEGDLVVAADGIKSGLRRQIAEYYNHQDRIVSTGDSAYRIIISKERINHDPAALKLLSKNVGMRWMGPGGHIMAYPLRNNTVYNMVLLHPEKKNFDNLEAESWVRKGDKKEMMDFYKDWCPEVRNLLRHVPEGEVMEWALNSHQSLPSWYENKVVLVGDASHPMLPYVGQGAAQAMEDAAALQCVLAKSSTDISLALEVYEKARKMRGEYVQSSGEVTRQVLHLPDGPEQQGRDQKIKAAANGHTDNPDLWADRAFQQFIWGTDIMKDTLVQWLECEARAKGSHTHVIDAIAC